MAIRVSHARIEDVGRLGIEAGKGEQQVREQAQQVESDLQAASNASRIQAAQINASTAIQKAVMDAQNNREMQEFDSFMRAESERRQIAWRTEQVEMTQRHDFDMNIQRKDLENAMIMEQKARKDAEVDQKKQSLQKARENFDITDDQYKNALLSLDVGVNPAKALFGEGGEIGLMQTSTYKSELAKEKTAAERAKPESVAMRTADIFTQITAEIKDLDPETQAEARRLMKTPNLSEAAATGILDTLKAKKEVLAKEKRLGITGGFAFGP
jgi:hypothetical protein